MSAKASSRFSRRVALPAVLQGTSDPDQGLQQFVSQSSWDERALGRRYRALMADSFADAAGVFVLDDTTFPKAGTHSVGVPRQYCGALGKKANCQAAVSLHCVGAKGHVSHHATLVMLAFGFLALEQRRAQTKPPSKKSRPPRQT